MDIVDDDNVEDDDNDVAEDDVDEDDDDDDDGVDEDVDNVIDQSVAVVECMDTINQQHGIMQSQPLNNHHPTTAGAPIYFESGNFIMHPTKSIPIGARQQMSSAVVQANVCDGQQLQYQQQQVNQQQQAAAAQDGMWKWCYLCERFDR